MCNHLRNLYFDKMDDLMEQLMDDGSESLSEFFQPCVIGYSRTGQPIMSFKKMVKQLTSPDFDQIDAIEFFENNPIFDYPSLQNAIILMDLD
jgi:hypothetical protein